MEPMLGFEPRTFSLPRKRSTPELHRLTKRPMLFSVTVGAQDFALTNLCDQPLKAHLKDKRVSDGKTLLGRLSVMEGQRRGMRLAATLTTESALVLVQPPPPTLREPFVLPRLLLDQALAVTLVVIAVVCAYIFGGLRRHHRPFEVLERETRLELATLSLEG